MKYAIKLQADAETFANPFVCTFNTAGSDPAEATAVAGRIYAIFYTLIRDGSLCSGTIPEIVVSPNAGGSGNLHFVKGQDVNPALTAYNTLAGGSVNLFDGANVSGSIMNIPIGGPGATAASLLPKGTSTLLVEQAASGPKGRIYVPMPNLGSLDAFGRPTVAHTTNVAKVFSFYYGFFSGTPELPKIFGVRSAAGFSLIQGVKASALYSHLKSRTR